jgi:hypothetical protein
MFGYNKKKVDANMEQAKRGLRGFFGPRKQVEFRRPKK